MSVSSIESHVVKCAIRSSRANCGCAEADKLWRAHRRNDDGSYGGPVRHDWCDTHQTAGYTWLGEDGREHVCAGQAPKPSFGGVHANGNGNGSVDIDKVTKILADGLAPVFAELMTVKAGQIDAEEVRAIVKAEQADMASEVIKAAEQVVNDAIRKLTVPTVVEIRKPNGEAKTIRGTHKMLPFILAAIQEGVNLLMVGPMGTGKSTIARHIAQAFDGNVLSFSVNPQMTKTDILGYMIPGTGEYCPSNFRIAWESANWTILMDELDTANPAVATIINDAFASRELTFPDSPHPVKLGEGNVLVGAANTYGRGPDRVYVGRNQLDGATADRFSFIEIEVDEALELAICHATGLAADRVEMVLSTVKALRRSAEVNRIPVSFGPRCSQDVCRLVKAGWTQELIINGRFRRGLSEKDWDKLTNGVHIPKLALI